MSVCRSVGRSVGLSKKCQKLSKSLNERDFNIELETKYISNVGYALNLSLDTFLSVCLSVSLSKNGQKLLNRGNLT